MYTTLAKCPVCGEVFDRLSHPDPEPNDQMVSMLVSEHRREHAKESPSCVENRRWLHGWDLVSVDDEEGS